MKLSPEQIADGWVLYSGTEPDVSVGTPIEVLRIGYGTELERYEIGLLENTIDYDDDPIGHVQNEVFAYRVFAPVRPDEGKADHNL